MKRIKVPHPFEAALAVVRVRRPHRRAFVLKTIDLLKDRPKPQPDLKRIAN